ncbi:MAG: hypothetical protein ACRBBP_02120 [Bdellovibrionales bacterium]
MLKFLKILPAAFLCSACIQLPVGSKKIEQYKNVQYNEPTLHFTPTNEFSADRAWINKSTGSIISYKSECSSGSQNAGLFLQNIASEFYPAKTSAISTFKYNSRKALRQRIKTEIEGIPTAFDLVVFKKYGCLFLMSHSGVSKNFAKTETVFDQFLHSFKVQR